MTSLEIGKKLVELLKGGRTLEALDTLFSRDVVSVEAQETPGFKKVTEVSRRCGARTSSGTRTMRSTALT